MRSFNLQSFSPVIADIFGGRPTATGMVVSEMNALSATAIWAAIRVVSGVMASLPLPVYKKMLPRGKERDPNHPLYSVLHDIANPEMTAFQYRETQIMHMMLYGNHYAEIVRNGAGEVVALWPLNPWSTYPVRDAVTADLWYVCTLRTGEQRKLPFNQVLHIAGMSLTGLIGLNPVRTMADSIGLSKALDYFAAKFFGNGARIGGVLEHPSKLSKEAHDRLRTSLDSIHTGLDNAHRMAIFEEGMKFHEVMANPEQSQLLDSRKYQLSEVSRITGVPMHLLSSLERSTNNNIEHQSLEFVIYCLQPWAVRIEQAIFLRCFTPKERKKWFAEHLFNGILRGDIKTRYDAYKTAIQNGILSPNDVREIENLNPIDGGDIYLAPLNMIPLDLIHEFYEGKKVGDVSGSSTGTNTGDEPPADDAKTGNSDLQSGD